MAAESAEFACHLGPAVAQVVTWLLVVGGWIYTNHTNNKRETRKELRAAIDKIKTETDELAKLGHTYYLADSQGSHATGTEINIRFNKLTSSLQNLTDRNEKLRSAELSRKMMAFMDQLTGYDFQSKERTVAQPDSPRLHAISAAAMEVQNELEKLFSSAHK